MKFWTYLRYDLKYSVFTVANLFYLILMPAGFYLLFGAMQDYGEFPLRDGNVAAYVMLNMATYGAVLGALSAASTAVTEMQQGWGRQLALTPIPIGKHLLAKILSTLVTTALPVIAVNSLGSLSGAKIPLDQQILCSIITILVASIFAFFGTAVALIFKSSAAVSISAGATVFMAFFGTTFASLSKELLEIARFTPMYGVTQLARFVFTGGETGIASDDSFYVTEPLSYALLNFLAWGIIFVVATFLLRKRSKQR